MPLESGGQNAYVYGAGVEFGMHDEKAIVRVRVTDTALDDLEPSTKRNSDYVGIFNRHREKIEKVAARKYANREVEGDGTVLVRTADLNRASI